MLGMDVVEKAGFRKEKGSFMGSVSHWTDIDTQGCNASHKRKKKKKAIFVNLLGPVKIYVFEMHSKTE